MLSCSMAHGSYPRMFAQNCNFSEQLKRSIITRDLVQDLGTESDFTIKRLYTAGLVGRRIASVKTRAVRRNKQLLQS